MNDHTTLIAELLEHAGWEEERLNQACADVLRRAAETLEEAAKHAECDHGNYNFYTDADGLYTCRCLNCGYVWRP